jgi:hypothetical protein
MAPSPESAETMNFAGLPGECRWKIGHLPAERLEQIVRQEEGLRICKKSYTASKKDLARSLRHFIDFSQWPALRPAVQALLTH